MVSKKIVYSVLLVSALLIFTIIVSASEEKQKIRVIAHNAKEVADAVSQGCTKVRDGRVLHALECQQNVAGSLGLQEDVKVFAVDAGANTQIRANLVQASGNNGDGRKIAVLDTGYNYNHRELSSSYLGGKDFVNNDNDPFDDNGHGSHVAGIITADGVDARAKGVVPGAGIIAGKVLDSSGSGFFSDVVEAIYWAVNGPDGIYGQVCTSNNSTNQTICTNDDFNADAISLSLGTSAPYLYKGFCDGVLPDLTNAISYAKSKNVLVVVAAGNSGNAGVSLPGCISYSTTVGAVDSKDNIASFSGRGNAVDISAPGVSIYSSWLGTSYVTASGTSMATPMVSGTVALIKLTHPAYTASQVENALFSTAKDLGKAGKDTSYGYGRVDAYSSTTATSTSKKA